VLTDAIRRVTNRADVLVYGISDRPVGGIDVLDPNGNPVPVSPENLGAGLPSPFKEEPKGGSGTRMHHKFVVIDFDTPAARVWLGSHNFSPSADTGNGENLLLFRDARIATAYAVEALRIYDHYAFRISQQATADGAKPLQRPPRSADELAWWDRFYTEPVRVRDRELFSKA
jgi:phosphatidylserine/phosphatidylglycerophosphate/cardiolipin synthase-like enzyme